MFLYELHAAVSGLGVGTSLLDFVVEPRPGLGVEVNEKIFS